MPRAVGSVPTASPMSRRRCRASKAVHDWLGTRSAEWLDGVHTVAIDPFRGYATGVASHLGHATLVVDRFHVVALANRAIDDVRSAGGGRRSGQQRRGRSVPARRPTHLVII
jgi:transposase